MTTATQDHTTAPANSAASTPQTALDEKPIDSPELEALIDKREERKATKKEATAAFKEMDDAVKARIAEFDLPEGEVARCGKYRIEKRPTKGRSVSFETAPSSRLTISLFED